MTLLVQVSVSKTASNGGLCFILSLATLQARETMLGSYPFDDPMPRIVPGEVIASTQLESVPPRRSARSRFTSRSSNPSAPVTENSQPEPPEPPEPASTDTSETPLPDTGAVDQPPVTSTQSFERPPHTEPEPGPQVAILTLREIRPITDYGGLHEAEDVLVEALSAALHRVVLSSPRYAKPPFDRPILRRALNSSRLVHPLRIEHHATAAPADTMLVLARDIADAAALVGVPGWWELARTVIVHIEVVTERDLRRYPELVPQLRRRVDALFSGTEMPPLGHLGSARLTTIGVVPPMLDVLAFPTNSERSIDVFYPGERPPGQDQLLRHWADTHSGRYQRGVGQLGAITSHDQHRKIFTSMAARSRLLLTNYDQFDRSRHAGAHREVGGRFYDAMAAGCALFGDLPVGSRRFAENVAPAQPLGLPAQAQQLPSEVVEALNDRAESDRLGTEARACALRSGDVAHRWTEMITAAELPQSPGIEQRTQQLAAIAEQLTG